MDKQKELKIKSLNKKKLHLESELSIHSEDYDSDKVASMVYEIHKIEKTIKKLENEPIRIL